MAQPAHLALQTSDKHQTNTWQMSNKHQTNPCPGNQPHFHDVLMAQPAHTLIVAAVMLRLSLQNGWLAASFVIAARAYAVSAIYYCKLLCVVRAVQEGYELFLLTLASKPRET